MAARVYDIYDLNQPFVTPTAPAPAAATAQAQTSQPATATRDLGDRALRGFIGLAVLAGALLLAAVIVTVTPLGAIDADITVPFLAAVLGGLGAIAWAVMR